MAEEEVVEEKPKAKKKAAAKAEPAILNDTSSNANAMGEKTEAMKVTVSSPSRMKTMTDTNRL
tara:strand:- start:140 stop:328 length:189 start_codon:yes stop_codon:yes gene_type:complete